MSFHYYSPTLLFRQEAGNCAFEWFGLVCGAVCMVRSGSRNFGQGGHELAILAKGVGEGRGGKLPAMFESLPTSQVHP